MEAESQDAAEEARIDADLARLKHRGKPPCRRRCGLKWRGRTLQKRRSLSKRRVGELRKLVQFVRKYSKDKINNKTKLTPLSLMRA